MTCVPYHGGVTRSFRLLSIGPRIRKEGGRLVATSSLRLLCLGAFCREVVVEPHKGWLMINDQAWWFLRKSRLIPFDKILNITYGFEDVTPGGWLVSVRDTKELFRVGLRLQDGGEFDLFRFFGDGPFVNEGIWPNWMYWEDYLSDLTGSQENESPYLVELLCQMTGAKIDRPKY